MGLAPYIDLCNHSAGHQRPTPADLAGDDPEAAGSNSADQGASSDVVVWVANSLEGQVRPLRAGQELYITYVANCSPLQAWLNFGFVPPELLQLHGP